MNRFHTVEKVTVHGTQQILFKRGKRILAWIEKRIWGWGDVQWDYSLGIPSKKPHIYYWSNTYDEAEANILNMLKDRKEV